MKYYYVSKAEPKMNHAGSKAVRDVGKILDDEGYNLIEIYGHNDKSKMMRKLKNYFSLSHLNAIENNSLVLIEHPLYISGYYLDRLAVLKAKKYLKLVFLFHDIQTLRGSNDKIATLNESKIITIADALIVHNRRMRKYCAETMHFDNNKIIELGIFDYLCKGNRDPSDRMGYDNYADVAIAGNLSKNKSGYIYKLSQLSPLTFNLYGVNYSGEDSNNTKYCGSIDADILPNIIEGKYGLVWDGKDLDDCTGSLGKYMKYNSPHKLSMYVAAEMPVIIWEKAAEAEFVINNNIGFTVNSLSEIEKKMKGTSTIEYMNYHNNIRELSKKVREGFFLRQAIHQANEILFNK